MSTVRIDKLAEFLGLSPRRVRQLVEDGTISAAIDKEFDFLPSVKQYIVYLQQCSAGKAVSDEAKEKQAAQIGLLQAQRDSAQIALDIKRGALVPAEAVRSAATQLVRVLSEGADSLADILERKVGLSGEALVQVSQVTDQWRTQLHERAVDILGASVLPDTPTKPVRASAPRPDRPPKPRGRPRTVQKDKFTPDLVD